VIGGSVRTFDTVLGDPISQIGRSGERGTMCAEETLHIQSSPRQRLTVLEARISCSPNSKLPLLFEMRFGSVASTIRDGDSGPVSSLHPCSNQPRSLGVERSPNQIVWQP
jgi:hypothetical protein